MTRSLLIRASVVSASVTSPGRFSASADQTSASESQTACTSTSRLFLALTSARKEEQDPFTMVRRGAVATRQRPKAKRQVETRRPARASANHCRQAPSGPGWQRRPLITWAGGAATGRAAAAGAGAGAAGVAAVRRAGLRAAGAGADAAGGAAGAGLAAGNGGAGATTASGAGAGSASPG